MYLKSIKAYGFKSFADKIELEIKDGITGIVGPNGSGKSNIVDAIRWVLGEQSIKALRGNNIMSDVIFGGSKSRDKSNRAMVSLTFDNTDHYLNSEFNEVEVKRILYRNGDNEYLINNSKVRLKDITDLFVDTLASKESFNIISQGKVSDIINNKPVDRRFIIEEAAGVVKYKKRKIDTLKKLEKANDNLEKVTLLINELKDQVEPLREQSIVATKYLKLQESLENTEVSMIAKDITSIKEQYDVAKKNQEELIELCNKITLSNTTDISKLEKLKLTKIKVDEDINHKSEQLIGLEKELAELDAQKQLAQERKKYEVDDMKLQNNIVSLQEEVLNINKNIITLESSLNNLTEELKNKNNLKKDLDDKVFNLNHKHYTLEAQINNTNKDILETQNKINILQNNIEQNSSMPYAVKAILNNPRLSHIHGTLSSLLDVEEKYLTAINISLGASNNVIVVDKEIDAKNCINYLKDQKLGRVTFFPLNVIKEKFIDNDTLDIAKKDKGFIDIASNLVKYDEMYANIVKNQLGNILVVDNIDTLNKLAKVINYKYRIVTLEGDIVYPGGAITGGILKKDDSLLKQKQELFKLNDDLKYLNDSLSSRNKEYQDNLNELNAAQDTLTKLQNEIVILSENVNQKELSLSDLKKNYKSKEQELNGTSNLKDNKIDDEIKEILEKYYDLSSKKELLEQDLKNVKKHKEDIELEINDFEEENRKINSEYNKKQNELKEIEIKLGKWDVKIDNYLNILNETYQMTYDKAKEIADPDIDLENARVMVAKIKSNIRALGEVNTGSIAEYERVNTRYEFLVNQEHDLNESITELLSIINDMDEIMITKFKEAFDEISKEFSSVFTKMFKGGTGKLVLTDEDNILETGIEIIAEPPGKKLNSIALLSGGEKTLTAIALLFAILNVRPVPFVVLDEVEAALDDANVITFGKYLESKKDSSQFIVITHKKKTMEYTDTLYGITMQESGVSKLVSVKMED